MKKTILLIIAAVLILAGPLSVLLGTAYTFTLPRLYESTATIQVVFPEQAERQYDASALTLMTKTQLELISSTPILNEVIQNLKLNQTWGRHLYDNGSPLPKNVSRKLLSQSMKLKVLPETVGLISIGIVRDDPTEAARIANEVASVYRDKIVNSPQQGGTYQVSLVSPATPPIRPVSPNLHRNIMQSLALAGVFFLAGIVLLLLALKQTNRTRQKRAPSGAPPPLG